MSKNKKELKSASILILAFVALTFIRGIVDLCVNGFPRIDIPSKEITEELIRVVSIIVFVLAVVLYLPEIYIGIKGIKIANGAKSGKAHIVWSLVLAVLVAISLISQVEGLIKNFNFDTFVDVLGPAADFIVFIFYFIYARRVKNEQ